MVLGDDACVETYVLSLKVKCNKLFNTYVWVSVVCVYTNLKSFKLCSCGTELATQGHNIAILICIGFRHVFERSEKEGDTIPESDVSSLDGLFKTQTDIFQVCDEYRIID